MRPIQRYHASKQLNDEESHRRKALSTDDARVAMSKCTLCATPHEEKRLFRSLFGTIGRCISRIFDQLMKAIWAAVALEGNDEALPKVVASYVDNLMTEISASATLDVDALKCYVSQMVDFMFHTIFPDRITMTQTFVAAKDAWIPDVDAETATIIKSLPNSLQS
jgi:hypothetical protein